MYGLFNDYGFSDFSFVDQNKPINNDGFLKSFELYGYASSFTAKLQIFRFQNGVWSAFYTGPDGFRELRLIFMCLIHIYKPGFWIGPR